MDHGIRSPSLQFSHRYRYAREKMPYYAYHCKPIGPPLPLFVKKRLPRYGSQYFPLYGSRYVSSRSIPFHRRGIWMTPYSLASVAGYQPWIIPRVSEACSSKSPKLRTTRNPVRPYVDSYQYPLQTTVPYDGMTKGPHGPINKGSLPCVIPERVLRVTKGPVLYSSKDLHPSSAQIPLRRACKGPVFYASQDPLLCSSKEELPRVSKGPDQYPLKGAQRSRAADSYLPMTEDPPQSGAKVTQPRATKGPRLIATKVPRFSALTVSRSFLKRGVHSFLTKTSQTNLCKGSRSSLSKTSWLSLGKGSQPSLVRTATTPAPKTLSKNVKISSTGKKYCSTTKWPF
ncbi:uncharacterized protein LOC103048846 [Python bivittatus]|uniref:Uncharacterized protein LOC103048846 n=1 Tax=Python bivittatus TaxID=176946 RepID=A0A9F2Q4I9_PYTBI|nr:uncharacterized protein LOC103048846 [Python bivittatus]